MDTERTERSDHVPNKGPCHLEAYTYVKGVQGGNEMAYESDEELVKGLKSSVPVAYVSYSNSYGTTIFRFIAARTHNLQDAEEIHQDVLWKAINTWRPGAGCSFRSWLYMLAKQAIQDWVRAKARQPKTTSLDQLLTLGWQPRSVQPTQEISADNSIEEIRQKVRTYVSTLPQGEQDLYDLCFVRDLDDGQVADALGVKTASVKTMRCRLARKIDAALSSR